MEKTFQKCFKNMCTKHRMYASKPGDSAGDRCLKLTGITSQILRSTFINAILISDSCPRNSIQMIQEIPGAGLHSLPTSCIIVL